MDTWLKSNSQIAKNKTKLSFPYTKTPSRGEINYIFRVLDSAAYRKWEQLPIIQADFNEIFRYKNIILYFRSFQRRKGIGLEEYRLQYGSEIFDRPSFIKINPYKVYFDIKYSLEKTNLGYNKSDVEDGNINLKQIQPRKNYSRYNVFDRTPEGLTRICPFDLSLLDEYNLRMENIKGGLTTFMTMKCKTCGHVFTDLPLYRDLEIFEVAKDNSIEQFINIKMSKKEYTRHADSFDEMLRIHELEKKEKQGKILLDQLMAKTDQNEPNTDSQIALYLAERDLGKIENELSQILERRKERKERNIRNDQIEKAYYEKRLQAKKEKLEKQYETLVAEATQNPRDECNITPQDFVIKRSMFKCIHAGHNLQDLMAKVDIINAKDEQKTVEVAAGYCPECNIYYIIDSSFKLLAKRGIPLCKIKDEKFYTLETNRKSGKMNLSEESILMQYGYTVNASDNLSPMQRQRIIAVLIDNGIVSKSEIISLLDFFISQREGNEKMGRAVDKWNEDREFVEDYNPGTYTRVAIKGLQRN